MDTMKKVGVGFLVLILFIMECMFMGIFALDTGSSPESVRDGLETSQIVTKMTEEVLSESTVNMGGKYGEKMEAVMGTEAMTDFFTEYVSQGIQSVIYGKECEEIATDELLRSFAKGIGQVNDEGKLTIGPGEQALFLVAITAAAPDLTASLNEIMGKYQITTAGGAEEAASQAESIALFAPVLTPAFRAGLAAAMIVALLLIVLFAKTHARGLVLSGAATLAAAALYGGLSVRGYGSSSEPVDTFISVLIEDGARTVSLGAGIIGGALLLLAIVFAVKGKVSQS